MQDDTTADQVAGPPAAAPDVSSSQTSNKKRARNASQAGRAKKKLKREEYRAGLDAAARGELPKKKFYRQRAHANPFSDHVLT